MNSSALDKFAQQSATSLYSLLETGYDTMMTFKLITLGGDVTFTSNKYIGHKTLRLRNVAITLYNVATALFLIQGANLVLGFSQFSATLAAHMIFAIGLRLIAEDIITNQLTDSIDEVLRTFGNNLNKADFLGGTDIGLFKNIQQNSRPFQSNLIKFSDLLECYPCLCIVLPMSLFRTTPKKN